MASESVKSRYIKWRKWHCEVSGLHDDAIKWKHFPRYWPFVRGIHRSPVNSPHKGHSRGALMFSLICAWANGWVNTREAGELRRHRAHYDVTVMSNRFSLRWMMNHLPLVWWSNFRFMFLKYPPVTGGFPSQRQVVRSFDVFFDYHLNQRLSKKAKKSRDAGDLRRHRAHYDVTVMGCLNTAMIHAICVCNGLEAVSI